MDKRIYCKGIVKVDNRPEQSFDFWVNWWPDQPEVIGSKIAQLIHREGKAYDLEREQEFNA